MSFTRNDYLRWYIPLIQSAGDAVNLHSSGAPYFNLDDVVPAKSDGHPFERFPMLEAKLARWLGIPPSEICYASGATGGTLKFLLAMVGEDREIVVESPMYEPMVKQATRLGKLVRFRCEMEKGWVLPLDNVQDLITSSTGAVMITEPLNPAGVFRDREDILALADMAARVEAPLLINEVYRSYTDAPSFHGERDNIVTVASLSKLCGFYGLRLGWLSGKKSVIAKMKGAGMNLSMPAISIASTALTLMDRVDDLRAQIIETSRQGTHTVASWVGATPHVTWTKPEGPGFCTVKLPARFSDDIAFTKDLLDKRGVLVIPGTFFELPGTIRISWLQSSGRLEEGLEALSKHLGD